MSTFKPLFVTEKDSLQTALYEFTGNGTSKSPERNVRLQEMIDSGEMKRKQQARRWE